MLSLSYSSGTESEWDRRLWELPKQPGCLCECVLTPSMTITMGTIALIEQTTSHECKKVRPAVVARLTSAAVLDQDLLHSFNLGGDLSRRVE